MSETAEIKPDGGKRGRKFSVSLVIAIFLSLVLMALAIYWGIEVTDDFGVTAPRDIISSRTAVIALIAIWATVLAVTATNRKDK